MSTSRWRGMGYAAMTLVVLVAGLYAFGIVGGHKSTRATALFASAKGLYVGDDVRILGVRVGRVDKIEPAGDHVRVTFSIPADQKVPADANAVIMAPSLVASRFVQLAPAYDGGPILRDRAVIPEERTAVPEEFDDVKQQLTRLADALGPRGTAQGSLARFIKVADRNLGNGNARRLRDSIRSLSTVADSLASGRGDLFDTVKNLNTFITALVQNDAAVRQFASELDGVSGTLSDDRQSLALALDTLGAAFTSMNTFLRSTGGEISGNVRELAELSSTLAEQTRALEQVLHVAPVALSNLYNIIDPRFGAFTGILGLGNVQAGAPGLACGLFAGLLGMTPTPSAAQLNDFRYKCRTVVGPFAQLLGVKDSAFPNGSAPIPGLNPAATGPSLGDVAPRPSTAQGPRKQTLLGLLLGGLSR